MILGLLREETKGLHERVERTVDLPTRLRSVEHYTSLLGRFYGFYAPLEERLARLTGYEAVGLDIASRRKTHLIHDDLAALGLEKTAVLSLPRCRDLPGISDAGEGLGCLYVLEGATLGGQVVRRQVESQLGLSPGRGCSFFASYGEKVVLMWKEFCQSLEAYAAAELDATSRILAAAAGTFACLDRWVKEGPAC